MNFNRSYDNKTAKQADNKEDSEMDLIDIDAILDIFDIAEGEIHFEQ